MRAEGGDHQCLPTMTLCPVGGELLDSGKQSQGPELGRYQQMQDVGGTRQDGEEQGSA